MSFDHRGIGRAPFRPTEFGPLAFAAVVVGVALWTAPDAEDAMRAVRAEKACPEVQATIREYRNRQWAAEHERDEARDLARQYRKLLYRHGILRVPAGRLEP